MKFLFYTLSALGIAFSASMQAEESFTLPEGKVLASFEKKEEESRTVAWYYTSESPVKRRALAQTFKSSADGVLSIIAIPLVDHWRIPDLDLESLPLLVRFYDHGASVPDTRPNKGGDFGEQPIKVEVSPDGALLLITLQEPVLLVNEGYYTFILDWQFADPNYKISFQQVKGNEEFFRWHRSNRDSWVRSTDSLRFYAIATKP